MKAPKILTALLLMISIPSINALCQEDLEEQSHLKQIKKGGTTTLLTQDDKTIAEIKNGKLLYMYKGQEIQTDYDKSMFICIDKSGNLILNPSNEPELVKAFEYYIKPVAGMQMSWTKNDVYGRVELQGRTIFPCVDCEQLTGVKNAVFVW